MATLQQIQEAARLKREKGLTPAQAVEQVRTATSTANTPVTPPPTPTQIPTPQVENAPVAGVAPQVTPTTPTPAPAVAPQSTATPTPAPTPVTPAPTPEAKVEPTPITPTKTPEEIKRDEISAKNEAQMALNKQKAEQKQAERDLVTTQANNQLAGDENAIFNTLKAGGIIPEVVKTSPNYKNALNTYNKLQQYSSYSVGQLTTALDNGAILPGTSLYNEMMKDPEMKTKLTEAQIYTTGKANQPQKETVTQEILSSNPTTASFLADGVITQEEWDNATNNSEVVAKAKDVEAKTNKYNEKYAEWEAVEDEVNAQFPGSPFADSIIADRKKAKWKDVILAKGEMDTANGTLTELKTKAASLFETNLKLYESRRAEQMQIQAEKRAIQAKKDMLQYESDFERKQAEIALNDPATAIKSVMDEYKKLGIPFTSTVQSRLDEFKKSGLSLPDYLTQMTQNIQASPAYQQYAEMKKGELSDTQKLILQSKLSERADIRNFEQQKELARIAKDNARAQFLFELENDPEKKAKAFELEQKLNANKSLFDVLGKNVGTYEGNRGYDLAGKIGDPLPAGGNWTVKSIDTAGEQFGSIFKGGKGSKPWGNTVVMVDEDGNEIRYSHLDKIGVKPGDVLGFGDIVGTRGNTGNVLGANGEKLTAEQLQAGRGAHLDIEIKDKNGKLLSQQEQVNWLKSKKAGGDSVKLTPEQQRITANQEKSAFRSNPVVKEFEEMYAQNKNLVTSLAAGNAPGDMAAVFQFMKSLDPASVVRESEFELAAQATGLGDRAASLYDKVVKGEKLTDSQREEFKKLSTSYVQNKAKSYNRVYGDMERTFNYFGLPSEILPEKIVVEGNTEVAPSMIPEEEIVDIYSQWKANQ